MKDELLEKIDKAIENLEEALEIAVQRPLLEDDILELRKFIDELSEFCDDLLFG